MKLSDGIMNDTVTVAAQLCKDCEHFRSEFMLPLGLAKCAAPKNYKEDQVTGKSTILTGAIFCGNNRDFDSEQYCGNEGRWFKPKIKKASMWIKFVNLWK